MQPQRNGRAELVRIFYTAREQVRRPDLGTSRKDGSKNESACQASFEAPRRMGRPKDAPTIPLNGPLGNPPCARPPRIANSQPRRSLGRGIAPYPARNIAVHSSTSNAGAKRVPNAVSNPRKPS